MFSRIRGNFTAVVGQTFLILLPLALCRQAASAQGAVVIISGTVTGPNAVAIPGATVTAVAPDSLTRRTTTDDKGKYRLIFNSGAGAFHLTVTAPGYMWWAGDVRKAYNDDRIPADVTLRRDETADPSKRTAVTPAVVFSRAQLGPNDALFVVADSGDVMIRGTATDQIVYHTFSHSLAQAVTDSIGMPKEVTATGTQTIADYGLTLAPAEGVAVMIEVPRKTTIIRVRITGTGGVRVSDFDGQLSIQSASGDVWLDRISGPALVEARNGPITATLAAIPSRMNFLGHNGAITLTLPADGRASISAEVHQGVIFHDSTSRLDLPARFTLAKPSDIEAYRVGMPAPVEGTKSSWVMNGGGAAITATSLNGDIIIRRALPKRP